MKRKKFDKILSEYKFFLEMRTFSRIKGSLFLDADYVYAPYVPLHISPIIKKE